MIEKYPVEFKEPIEAMSMDSNVAHESTNNISEFPEYEDRRSAHSRWAEDDRRSKISLRRTELPELATKLDLTEDQIASIFKPTQPKHFVGKR